MKILEKKFAPLPNLPAEVKIDKSLPDLSQHPAVLRKVDRALKILEESPIPKDLFKRK
jgi:hypothetical protein